MPKQNLKYFIILLLLCLAGRAFTHQHYSYSKKQGSVTGKFYEAKKLSQDNQDEVPYFKKKYKAKGLQVIVPLIGTLTFKFFHLASDIQPIPDNATCLSFLYCARYKRGPPSPVL